MSRGALEIDIPGFPALCFALSGFETPSIPLFRPAGSETLLGYALASPGMPRLIEFGRFDQGHPHRGSRSGPLRFFRSSLCLHPAPVRVSPFLPFTFQPGNVISDRSLEALENVARRVGIPKIRSLISHSRLNSHAARARAQHGAARVLKLKWKWRNNQRRNAAQFQFACVARAR